MQIMRSSLVCLLKRCSVSPILSSDSVARPTFLLLNLFLSLYLMRLPPSSQSSLSLTLLLPLSLSPLPQGYLIRRPFPRAYHNTLMTGLLYRDYIILEPYTRVFKNRVRYLLLSQRINQPLELLMQPMYCSMSRLTCIAYVQTNCSEESRGQCSDSLLDKIKSHSNAYQRSAVQIQIMLSSGRCVKLLKLAKPGGREDWHRCSTVPAERRPTLFSTTYVVTSAYGGLRIGQPLLCRVFAYVDFIS